MVKHFAVLNILKKNKKQKKIRKQKKKLAKWADQVGPYRARGVGGAR
jgi:CelD/BcsL family acetyltransferase involved in cellulose biosynthesis